MENEEQKKALLIGRVFLAKSICFDWVSNNRKIVFISVLSLIVTAFGLYQCVSSFSPLNTSNSLSINAAFEKWMAGQTFDPKLFQQIEKPLKTHPELQSKFGTAIAQRLISFGDAKRGIAYANAALKRSQDLNTAYYSQFSKTTLLIAAQKYSEALSQAESLKGQMERDDAFWDVRDRYARSGSILFAYNLVRIAALHCQMGAKEKELFAWEELEKNAGWNGIPVESKTYDPEAYALLAQNFSQGDLSLLDYIAQRKTAVSQ